MYKLNIIGCGNVGKTLSKLWVENSQVTIGHILNRSLDSAKVAVDFVGQGVAASSISDMEPADIVMISASDMEIEDCASLLSGRNGVVDGGVVFNCSGVVSSSCLLKQNDWKVGSVHPVKSFASPLIASNTFAGTYCGIEGEPNAVKLLENLFISIGGITFPILEEFKTIYHSAAVIVCNYLVALIEASLQCYEKAGIDRQTSMKIITPFIQGTIENVERLGTIKALTGPIARGESSVIEKQITSLTNWNPTITQLYKSMGQLALELSEKQGNLSKEAICKITKSLSANQ